MRLGSGCSVFADCNLQIAYVQFCIDKLQTAPTPGVLFVQARCQSKATDSFAQANQAAQQALLISASECFKSQALRPGVCITEHKDRSQTKISGRVLPLYLKYYDIFNEV